jgi:hypothetical protein
MEEIKKEVMDIFIHAFLTSVYSSEMTDEECDNIIDNGFNILIDLLSLF